MASGIYSITSPSGRVYIGSAQSIAQRWARHRWALRNGSHHNIVLQRLFNKYGESALVFSIIETCDICELLAREQFHINAAPRAINIAPVAGSNRGIKRTAETCAKISASQLLQWTPEARERAAAAKRGTVRTLAANEKTSAKLRGRKQSAAHIEQAAAAKRGSTLSAASRANMSAARNTSGFKGVSLSKSGTWFAYSQINGKRVNMGSYKTPSLAFAMRLVQMAALPG